MREIAASWGVGVLLMLAIMFHPSDPEPARSSVPSQVVDDAAVVCYEDGSCDDGTCIPNAYCDDVSPIRRGGE